MLNKQGGKLWPGLRSDLLLLITLVPSAVTIAGNLAGGFWAASNIILLGLMAVLDWALGENDAHESEIRPFALIIPRVHILFFILSIASLLYSAASGRIHGVTLLLAFLSTAIHSTSAGGNSAHELIHKSPGQRFLGVFGLSFLGYSHFSIEHLRGHHARFALPGDPATACRGESIYHFFVRSSWQQFTSALALERRRLAAVKRVGRYSNQVILGKIYESSVMAAIFAFGGWKVGAVYVAHALTTVFFMQFPNYIGHYGLERGDELPSAWHSWQTAHRVSGLMLLSVGRHLDHHRHPSRPFPLLRSHRCGARLPSGLYGLLFFVMIPPLWFNLMHPLLAAVPETQAAVSETHEAAYAILP